MLRTRGQENVDSISLGEKDLERLEKNQQKRLISAGQPFDGQLVFSWWHLFIAPPVIYVMPLLHQIFSPSTHQREGMDLLDYLVMPSLHDLAHDGVLCTFSNRSASDRGKWCGLSGHAARHGPSNTEKITTCVSLSSSQPGEPPCWTSPLAYGPIATHHVLDCVPSPHPTPYTALCIQISKGNFSSEDHMPAHV